MPAVFTHHHAAAECTDIQQVINCYRKYDPDRIFTYSHQYKIAANGHHDKHDTTDSSQDTNIFWLTPGNDEKTYN